MLLEVVICKLVIGSEHKRAALVNFSRWKDKRKNPVRTPTFSEKVSVKVSNQQRVDWPLWKYIY